MEREQFVVRTADDRQIVQPLVCESCRAASPSLLSCIHTFVPEISESAWEMVQEHDLDEEKKQANAFWGVRVEEEYARTPGARRDA